MKIAAKAGLSEAEIEAAGQGRAASELDRAVLAAVDELDGDGNVSDRTWATLSGHLDERQLMDLVFTIGAYCLLAMAFTTFGVQPEVGTVPHWGVMKVALVYERGFGSAASLEQTWRATWPPGRGGRSVVTGRWLSAIR